ncbi:helix-turn-helix domain-containing protein [Pantoea agglomerans]|uniref:helix-turn-helix domain-containing protein n=1 Tax=Enterobacter agglomerans TaxID=549 RepID=UPI003C7D6345
MAKTQLNLSQAAEAVGITRRTLYNHIEQGRVTVSRSEKNTRVIDVSELIRVYGTVNLPEKHVPTDSHRKNAQSNFPNEALSAMRKELTELRELIQSQQQLLLEDKQQREQKNEAEELERQRLQQEVTELKRQLEVERKKGFLKRIFSK